MNTIIIDLLTTQHQTLWLQQPYLTYLHHIDRRDKRRPGVLVRQLLHAFEHHPRESVVCAVCSPCEVTVLYDVRKNI